METKKWYKSREMLWGLGAAVGGSALIGVQQYFEVNALPDPWNGVVLGIVGAAIMYLKANSSNTPVSK